MRETSEFRPDLHFTPQANWMNDPNGLIQHHNGYHLFFQKNPTGRTWGDIGWGHALSADLLSWEELPMAILASEEEMAFSGSAVWDRDNSSGLGESSAGPLVAVFTSAYTDNHPTMPRQQAQSIAFSIDDGRTWQRYDGNPVLGRHSFDFRDPKVFRHEASGQWVMVAVEARDRQVLIHTSPNLLDWELVSAFGPLGEPGIEWECPDLFEVRVEGTDESRWVLLLSTNPGGFCGGSGMRYWLGDFDGETFTPDSAVPRCFDHGPDMYAAVSFHGTTHPTVIGWMSNWVYAATTPTQPWQSAMTLPRQLSLVPAPAGLRIRHSLILPDEFPPAVVRAYFQFDGVGDVLVESGDGDAISRVVLRRGPDGALVVDRSDADPHNIHAQIPSTPPILLPEGPVDGVLVADHGLIEILLAEGTISVTMQTFPHPGRPRISATGDARLEGDS